MLIWALTSPGFFWPAFPMLGWGIGVAFHAWDTFRRQEPTEEQIAREVQRRRHIGDGVNDRPETGRPDDPGQRTRDERAGWTEPVRSGEAILSVAGEEARMPVRSLGAGST